MAGVELGVVHNLDLRGIVILKRTEANIPMGAHHLRCSARR